MQCEFGHSKRIIREMILRAGSKVIHKTNQWNLVFVILHVVERERETLRFLTSLVSATTI